MFGRMGRQGLAGSLFLLVGAVAFGIVDAIVKGHYGGTRNAIGDISAPWAILPLLAGAVVVPRRAFVGAVTGAGASIAALASYSLVRAGGHGVAGHAGLVAATANRWFLAGVIGGAGVGASGAWPATQKRWALLTSSAASLFVLEPAIRMFWAVVKGDQLQMLTPNPLVCAAEVLCGGALAIAGLQLQRRRATAASVKVSFPRSR
jgi:hypothetical protein